jgi:hypothetical protein
VSGRDRTVEIQSKLFLGAHFGGVKPVTFPPRAREEWGIICFARNQEIYWRIALLASDEPIRTLRGSVKMTSTQKPVRAITFAAPTNVFFGHLIT